MKVGTDGVLLGAWVKCEKATRILDVGCGSGLIGLMLAQKSLAIIDAIDIDRNAFLQSGENASNCKWSNRINIYHASLQEYAINSPNRYDLIVSNPPFFTNALKPGDEARANARHNHLLPFNDLVNCAWDLLLKEGSLYLILPCESTPSVIDIAKNKGFFIKRICEIRPRKELDPKRIMMELVKINPLEKHEETLVIEKEKRHDYTSEYFSLTKEFYLHF